MLVAKNTVPLSREGAVGWSGMKETYPSTSKKRPPGMSRSSARDNGCLTHAAVGTGPLPTRITRDPLMVAPELGLGEPP